MCMCDKDNQYLCFECEEYLKGEIKDIIHKHKNDILDSCDWWWAIGDQYNVNIFCNEDDPDVPEALFTINLYKLDQPHGTSSYDSSSQYDLVEPMTRKEIRLL